MTQLTQKINSYFAILLITIAGSGATFIIIHAAGANSAALSAKIYGTNSNYEELQRSILKS